MHAGDRVTDFFTHLEHSVQRWCACASGAVRGSANEVEHGLAEHQGFSECDVVKRTRLGFARADRIDTTRVGDGGCVERREHIADQRNEDLLPCRNLDGGSRWRDVLDDQCVDARLLHRETERPVGRGESGIVASSGDSRNDFLATLGVEERAHQDVGNVGGVLDREDAVLVGERDRRTNCARNEHLGEALHDGERTRIE